MCTHVPRSCKSVKYSNGIREAVYLYHNLVVTLHYGDTNAINDRISKLIFMSMSSLNICS